MKLPEHPLVFGTIDELTEHIYTKHMEKCKYPPVLAQIEPLRCTKEGIRKQLEYIVEYNEPVKINVLLKSRPCRYGPVMFYLMNDAEETSFIAVFVCITDESVAVSLVDKLKEISDLACQSQY